MLRNWLKKYLIPHQENDYKPHALQQAAVIGMLFLVLISFSVANIHSVLWVSSDWLVSTVLPAVIVKETNQERSSERMLPLRRSVALDEAAKQKAEDMAEKEYFAHNSPAGETPWYWFDEVGYDYLHAGENLAVHFTDSSAVVEAWMRSPTHRDNILNTNYEEIGIGTARGSYEGHDTVFVVQLFGTPALASESATVIENDEPIEVGADTEAGEVAGASAETVPVVAMTENDTVVYSSYVATSGDNGVATIGNIEVNRSGEEAKVDTSGEQTLQPSESVSQSTLPFIAFATKPQLLLQLTYFLVALFVLVAVGLSIFIEVRRQQPVQVAYGGGLIAVMFLLFYLHLTVASGITIA